MLLKSLVLAASAILTSATYIPPILQFPLPTDYVDLYNGCIAAGSTAYVGVRYANGYVTQFHYNQCYPYSLSGQGLAQVAVFCRAATCYNNPNPDCTGGAVPPIPVPVPPLAFLPNTADWVQFLGQGATCQPNALSDLIL